MTRQEIDTLWFKAMHESIKDNEDFTRYHFAALVAAAERSECVDIVIDNSDMDGICCTDDVLEAIRARG